MSIDQYANARDDLVKAGIDFKVSTKGQNYKHTMPRTYNVNGKTVTNTGMVYDLYVHEKDYKKAHTWEYAVSSKSLFGDSEIHRIRMEYQPRFESLLDPQVEYDIYVDGKKQTVYYPQWWDLQPHADFGKFVNPCFILNIDQ